LLLLEGCCLLLLEQLLLSIHLDLLLHQRLFTGGEFSGEVGGKGILSGSLFSGGASTNLSGTSGVDGNTIHSVGFSNHGGGTEFGGAGGIGGGVDDVGRFGSDEVGTLFGGGSSDVTS
jgi:hypothetical protein